MSGHARLSIYSEPLGRSQPPHGADADWVYTSFWATVCKTVRPMLSVRCLSVLSCLSVCLSVCDVRALWPNGWTDQGETWHADRPRSWPHCVRWGLTYPSPKGAQSPIFRPISVSAKWLHGSRCHLVWS